MRRQSSWQGRTLWLKACKQGVTSILVKGLRGPSLKVACFTGASQFPGRDSVRYATRAMVLAAEHARQMGAYADATYALMKAHFQVRVGALFPSAQLCLKIYPEQTWHAGPSQFASSTKQALIPAACPSFSFGSCLHV